jgi:hypothetical protein
MMTTNTLAGTLPGPPPISSTTLSSSPYYFGSSREDGSFSVSVRQSTNPAYNIYAYYTTIGSTGAVSTSYKKQTNVPVLSGQTVGPYLLQWP